MGHRIQHENHAKTLDREWEDTVAAKVDAGVPTAQALADIRSALDGDLGPQLLAATGIPNSILEAPYAALVTIGAELITDVPDSDVAKELRSHHHRPDLVIAALLAAGALARTTNGTLTLEPVMAGLWKMHRGTSA